VSKTGVVIRREDGRYNSFLVVPPPKALDPARLYWIASTVVKDCYLQPEEFVLLVIEHPTPRRQLEINFPLYWRLREEFGWYYETRTLRVWPAELNKFVTGSGKSSEIGGAVVRKWGDCLPEEVNQDVLDALALCKFGEAFLGRSGFTQEQMMMVRMEGTGKLRRERLSVDDHDTFRICEGGE
jgi:hypothetical protein